MQKSIIAIISALVVLISGATYFFEQGSAGTEFTDQVFFYDVGQGDATHIRSSETDILIDGGRSKKVLEYLGETIPYFENTIEFLILTHPDYDHQYGLYEVVQKYDYQTIFETDSACDKKLCDKWDGVVKQEKVEVADRSDRIELENGYVEFLYPYEEIQGKEVEDHNDASVIVCAVIYDTRILLTGDASKEIEEELVEKDALGSCSDTDVLKVGHHGSKTSTSPQLLERITPEYAIISAGAYNDYGHPHYDVLENLRNAGVTIFRTDTSGTITLGISSDEVEFFTET